MGPVHLRGTGAPHHLSIARSTPVASVLTEVSPGGKGSLSSDLRTFGDGLTGRPPFRV